MASWGLGHLQLRAVAVPASPDTHWDRCSQASGGGGQSRGGRSMESGCSLEDGLCRRWETCVHDGVFGRCQKVPVTDVYHYEVSPGAQQRLRAALLQLSRAGYAWQDDYMQHILARELAHVPRTHLRRPDAAHLAR
ncbi:PREDICTED: receptor-type tyrosine-protein phosphatase N2-like [Myotis davidii]|uniref:receptor-type tyrosine-protein phosphatase N2-like n=1 Tax=Myotis davidii TaxID=225400 RepID=UPI000766FE24|nr:PREDICTED: receptor-type tyrosine-protein phosphatase N2-like [Myotis davidii]